MGNREEGNYETIKSEHLIHFIKQTRALKNDATINQMTDSEREKRASLNVPRSHNNLPQLKVNLSENEKHSNHSRGKSIVEKLPDLEES